MQGSPKTQKLVIANWKSNFSWKQAENWAQKFAAARQHAHQYIVCPPFSLLGALQNQGFALGTQDLSPYEAGAYTGAVSPQNLEGLGVEYVILGHSERRAFFGETDQSVAQKVDIALAHNLTPIVCVDRDQFNSQAAALGSNAERCIVVYEPVHAISTFGGQEDPITVTLQMVENARRAFNSQTVLYGGNVNPGNSLAYLQPASIDGVLVGSASLDPVKFAQL